MVGDFTTNVLLGVDMSAINFAERATALQTRLSTVLEHRGYSGVQIVRQLIAAQGGAGDVDAAVVPVVFTSVLDEDLAPYLWMGKFTCGVSETPQVYLDCHAFVDQGALGINMDAVEGAFPAGMVQDMIESMHALLLSLADPAAWVCESRCAAPLPQWQSALLTAVNNTQADLCAPAEQTLTRQLLRSFATRQ